MMPDKLHSAILVVLLATPAMTSPAAAALPEGARAMIETARASGDVASFATVIRLARQTWPADIPEIEMIAWSDGRLLQPASSSPVLSFAVPSLAPIGMAAAPPEAILDGEGELGGFWTTGNSDSFGISAGLKLSRERGRWKHSLSSRADYQEANKQVTREFYQLGYKGDWKVSDRAYAFGLAQFESDRMAGFDQRWSVGSGVGVQLAKSDTLNVRVEGGPAFRHTGFLDGMEETNLSGRGALGIDWRLREGLRAKQDASIYAESGATSIQSTTALDAKLLDKLSARFSYSLRYESQPLPGAVSTDTVTRASVVYDF
jgi:putative salt-induced outer membrane protein